MSEEWPCECDWTGWSGCFKTEEMPESVPIKLPDKAGKYLVRVFDDDNYEEESEFSLLKKNWGQVTNQAISNWEIDYCDNWTGHTGVYAWKVM